MAFAVRTADKGLRAYRVPGEGEPEEVGRWGGVDCVLVGDFADLFRDQLLVLFSESEWVIEASLGGVTYCTVSALLFPQTWKISLSPTLIMSL